MLDILITVAVILAPLVTGYLIGLLQGGIHIHYNTTPKPQKGPVEYNESTASSLDPEVQKYFQDNNGMYKF